MTLTPLAAEYRQAADALEQRITLLRQELRNARGENALALVRRIELLYTELLDTRKIMGYLNRYYPH